MFEPFSFTGSVALDCGKSKWPLLVQMSDECTSLILLPIKAAFPVISRSCSCDYSFWLLWIGSG